MLRIIASSVILLALAVPAPAVAEERLVVYQSEFTVEVSGEDTSWLGGDIRFHYRVKVTVKLTVGLDAHNFSYDPMSRTLFVRHSGIRLEPVVFDWDQREIVEAGGGWLRRQSTFERLVNEARAAAEVRAQDEARSHWDRLNTQMPDRIRQFAYKVGPLTKWAGEARDITQGVAAPAASSCKPAEKPMPPASPCKPADKPMPPASPE